MKNSALPPLTLRPKPDTTPSLCRIAGCGGLVKARGFCARCAERVRVAGRLDDPLQQIRVILGCDPDGADQEVVDKARMFVQFRDGVERAVNAAGVSGYLLLEDLVAAVEGIAGERDRARDEVVNAHAALDAMPSTVAPDCPSPADRIKYATAAWLDERKEASNLATLCQNAHDALTAAGVANEGTPADRIRVLGDERDAARAELDAYRSRGVPPAEAPKPAPDGVTLSAREVRALVLLYQYERDINPKFVERAINALLGVSGG